MKKLSLLVLLAFTAAARAESHTVIVYGGLEVFGEDGASTGFKNDGNKLVDGLQATGISANLSETKTYPGGGARIGILIPRSDGFEIGGSLGIMAGPSIRQSFSNGPFSLNGVNFNSNGTSQLKMDSTLVRLLIEAAKKFAISDKSFFRVGVGIGGVAGNAHQTISTSGSANTLLSALAVKRDVTENWSGFTWEISPSLVFPLGNVEAEIGLRYAQFPTKKESDDMSKIEWNPLGAFFNVRFGA